MKYSTKDYVINLRVSKETFDKIKVRAKKNKDTASGLIRTLIDDSINTVADISSEVLTKANGDSKDAELVSYHKGILAQKRACKTCELEMKAGDAVVIGETSTGIRFYFCLDCKSDV
ncbi:MAG: hypothetical protein WC654_01550 [Patescibacteria group bacterium]